jgi:hypothetical protein
MVLKIYTSLGYDCCKPMGSVWLDSASISARVELLLSAFRLYLGDSVDITCNCSYYPNIDDDIIDLNVLSVNLNNRETFFRCNHTHLFIYHISYIMCHESPTPRWDGV